MQIPSKTSEIWHYTKLNSGISRERETTNVNEIIHIENSIAKLKCDWISLVFRAELFTLYRCSNYKKREVTHTSSDPQLEAAQCYTSSKMSDNHITAVHTENNRILTWHSFPTSNTCLYSNDTICMITCLFGLVLMWFKHWYFWGLSKST